MTRRGSHSPATKPGYHKGRKAPNAGKTAPRDYLTPEEYDLLKIHFSRTSATGKRNRAWVSVLYRTGMKPSQLIAMTMRHYHRGGRLLTIPPTRGYNEEKRGVHPETREALDIWLDERQELGIPRTSPLFCSLDGDPLWKTYINATLRRAAKETGVRKHVNPSALRRSYELERDAAKPRFIEGHAEAYIEGEAFRNAYPAAYDAWREAFDDYIADWARHSTAIGHHCRDAITAFAIELAARHEIPVPASAQSLDRMSAILKHFKKDAGTRVYEVLDSLFGYWRAVVGLINRQEHGADKGKPLTQEDARRVVFQTMLLMYEIDQTAR